MVQRFAPSSFVALLSALSIAACGDDGSSGKTASDTTQSTQTSATDTSTATSTNDTATVAPEVTNPAGCDRSGFVAASSSYDGESGFALFQALSGESEPIDALNIELYTSGQYEGAAIGPGTYSLDGTKYETCANCVLIRAECTEEKGCAKTFLADEGDLVIDVWDHQGGRFKGSLQGLKLHEVKISSTYVSTLVAGGETWCLDSFPFDAEIKALPVSDKTQADCVAAGTGNLLHDNIANLTLKNCLGEEVQLHATCGGDSEALWLIGTTGWCTACHEFLEAFRLKHMSEGNLTREAIATKTPGLDMLIILAENNDGEEPTEAFCKAYAEDMKIDPRMVVIDWTSAEVDIPLIDPEGYSIPTQALGNTWQAINPYLQADTSGSVTTAYPWWAILRAPNMEYLWSDGGAVITFDQALEDTLGRFPDELFE